MSERMELSNDDLEFFDRQSVADDAKRDKWAPKSPCCGLPMTREEFGPERCPCGNQFWDDVDTTEVDRVLRKVRR